MASRAASRLVRQALPPTLCPTSFKPALPRSLPSPSSSSSSSSFFLSSNTIRFAHKIPRPPRKQPPNDDPATAVTSPDAPPNESDRPEPRGPAYYQLSFTCIPCGHRSHHNVSKQGYHFGSTLITCPSCRNRHVISDHLNIFGDRKVTVEDLMREKGQLVKRGSLGEDGDIEFWPEDTLPGQAGGEDAGAGKVEKS